MKILLLSDTHSLCDDFILRHTQDCDEIWHAGDWGTGVHPELIKHKPVVGVYGNIDGQSIRQIYPEKQVFSRSDCTIAMVHIGGYPPKYTKGIGPWLTDTKPRIFISGHSHILKVKMDQQRNILHLNPGAAGIHGFHQVRTMLSFELVEGRPTQLKVIESDKKIQ